MALGVWQSSKVFSGLESKRYTLRVRDASSLCEGPSKVVIIRGAPQLTASYESTDVTANGGSDGTITITVSGGSGNYSFLWDDGPVTQNRTGLVAGLYSLTITDITTAVTFDLTDIPINEPVFVAPQEGTILDIPQVNSIRFVDDSVIDSCSNPQTPDNTFLLEQGDKFMKRDSYLQKFNICDTFNMQLNSDFLKMNCNLKKCIDDSIVESFDINSIKENIGNTETFNIRIQNNGSGQSRVYFTAGGGIPIVLEVGDVFEIVNNAQGFDGIYEILNILNDDILGDQYLVINKNYGIAAPSSLAEGTFLDQSLDFNIFFVQVDFTTVLAGNYYIQIDGLSLDETEVLKTIKSEPISLKSNHEATILLEYTNIDNAFNIDYVSGIVHRIRVPARMVKATPGAEQSSIRSTNGSVTKLSAKPQRKYLLEFFFIPAYLHELISLIFDHDVVRINTVQFGSQDGLQEPSYIDGYNLANSQIVVEQTEWFETYNGDDVGGVDGDSGFIEANGGFITRT